MGKVHGRLRKHVDKVGVSLDGDEPRAFEQCEGERADTRTDLEQRGKLAVRSRFGNPRETQDVADHVIVDEEVLAEGALRAQPEFLQNALGCTGICQRGIRHRHIRPILAITLPESVMAFRKSYWSPIMRMMRSGSMRRFAQLSADVQMVSRGSVP